MPLSDTYGRALEYVVVKKIIDSLPAGLISLSDRAIAGQRDGRVKFGEIPAHLQGEYLAYADSVFAWLEKEFKILKSKKIILDRIPDEAGKKGDVTDVRLVVDGKTINLSLKHNHTALKHQRPPRTAVQCGFAPKSPEDKKFRKEMDKIYLAFHEAAEKLIPGAETFHELKAVDKDFVDKFLYASVCKLVADFISEHPTPRVAAELFAFLVGNTDFYKLRAEGKKVFAQKFADIGIPHSVKAAVEKKSYVVLKFSNGWVVNMRLHTAATRIQKTPSLKFDTQAERKIEEVEI